jgi:hypothetical protein
MNQQVLFRFGAWGLRSAWAAALIVVGTLTSCSGGSFHFYSVGGSVSGLSGIGLVLQANGTDELTVTKPGAFSFSKHLPDGSAYKIAILAQPTKPIQNCVVMNGTEAGTLVHANVTSIAVRCANVGRFVYTNNVGSQNLSGGLASSSLSGYLIDDRLGSGRTKDPPPVITPEV